MKGNDMDIPGLGTLPATDELVSNISKYGLEKHIVELEAYGFTVIPPEKLDTAPDFVDRLREAMLREHGERTGQEIGDYRSAQIRAERPGDQGWWLLQDDDVFVDAVVNPVVLTMAHWCCGRSAVLAGAGSIIKGSSDSEVGRMPLHIDTHGVPPPFGPYPLAVNTSWLTTDYISAADGPTLLLPGSHRFGYTPRAHEAEWWKEGSPYKPVPLEAKAGSLAIWQGNTWHASMPRTNPGLRVTLVLVWMRIFMKPMNLWQDGFPPEIVDRYPELRKILGLEHPYPFKKEGPKRESLPAFKEPGEDRFA